MKKTNAINIWSTYFPDSYMDDKQTPHSFLEIIIFFTSNNDYYFHLYHELGDFLTEDEFIRYRTEIPDYFSSNGLFADKTISKFKNTKHGRFDPRIKAIGMLTMNENTYKMLPIICNYYCETTFFKPFPECTWDQYVNTYNEYDMRGSDIFIEMGYTDCVITYSEGLHVSLNMERYNIEDITQGLNNLGYIHRSHRPSGFVKNML